MKYRVEVDLYADGNWSDDGVKIFDTLEAAENRIDKLMRLEREIAGDLYNQPDGPPFAVFRAVPVH